MASDPELAARKARDESAFTALADDTRTLIDAVVRSTVDDDAVRRAQELVREAIDLLQREQIAGAYGTLVRADGTVRNSGNTVVGVRNPIAPLGTVHRSPEGRAWADFHVGAAYEGPPTLVHGGVTSLILDQIMGEAAAAGKKPGMTGTLTIIYRRGTPLGPLHTEAWIDRVEGIKTFVKATLGDADGVTVEAEGVFILPKWAREAIESGEADEWISAREAR